MYFIIDLWHRTRTAHETKQDLAAAWLRLTGPSYKSLNAKPRFDSLNVTGVDTYGVTEHTGKYCEVTCDNETWLQPIYVRKHYTRQYLITDEFGRHIDIRLWDASIWAQTAKPVRHSYYLGYSGSKQHHHRARGAHGYHRIAQAMCDIPDEDIIEILTGAQLETIKIRNKSLCPGMKDYDFYERRGNNKYSSSKCWKDQTKAVRQFAKQKPGKGIVFNKIQRMPGEQIEPGEDLVRRLSQEIVKSA